jgi:hypothetical protein
LNQTVPPQLDSVVLEALRIDPRARVQSAAEFERMLLSSVDDSTAQVSLGPPLSQPDDDATLAGTEKARPPPRTGVPIARAGSAARALVDGLPGSLTPVTSPGPMLGIPSLPSLPAVTSNPIPSPILPHRQPISASWVVTQGVEPGSPAAALRERILDEAGTKPPRGGGGGSGGEEKKGRDDGGRVKVMAPKAPRGEMVRSSWLPAWSTLIGGAMAIALFGGASYFFLSFLTTGPEAPPPVEDTRPVVLDTPTDVESRLSPSPPIAAPTPAPVVDAGVIADATAGAPTFSEDEKGFLAADGVLHNLMRERGILPGDVEVIDVLRERADSAAAMGVYDAAERFVEEAIGRMKTLRIEAKMVRAKRARIVAGLTPYDKNRIRRELARADAAMASGRLEDANEALNEALSKRLGKN